MLWECPVETLLAERDRHEVVLQLRIEREGAILCENRALFAEVKQLRLSQPRITVEREADGDDTLLRIVSPDYALFVTLNLPDGCDPSDNCFDLWPGEVRCVRVKGRPESINPEVRNYLDYR